MLPTEFSDIAAALAGVEQQREGESGARIDRVSYLELPDLALGSGVESLPLALVTLGSERGIGREHFHVDGIAQQRAQHLE